MSDGFKPITQWQHLEQDLSLFVLYCLCDGQPKRISYKWTNDHCLICGERYKPRREAGL